jgi:hypothetical protein
VKALLERPLHVVVDGELQPLAVDRIATAEILDLPAGTGDDNEIVAVLPHELRVVDLLDARLTDDRAGFESRVFRPIDLRFLNLAHVSEQVRRHRRIHSRRSRRHLDFGKLELAGPHSGPLRICRVLNDCDRTEDRIATVPIDDLADRLLIDIDSR